MELERSLRGLNVVLTCLVPKLLRCDLEGFSPSRRGLRQSRGQFDKGKNKVEATRITELGGILSHCVGEDVKDRREHQGS